MVVPTATWGRHIYCWAAWGKWAFSVTWLLSSGAGVHLDKILFTPGWDICLGIDEVFPPSNSKEKMSLPPKSWLLRGMLCVFLIHVLLKRKTVALFYLRSTLMLFIICEPKKLLKSPHLIHDHILLGYIKGVPLRIKPFCVKNRA